MFFTSFSRWLQKPAEPEEDMDFQMAKRAKLANLLLDSQQDLKADIEAILYRAPPSAAGRIASWLHPNRKTDSNANLLAARLYAIANSAN